jgi:hypothetical protein
MRLVFHMGLHKTGSTSLQGVLHGNAAELRRRGVHYAPAGGLPAHHHIAWAMLRGDFEPLRTAITDPEIGACDTVVVSSEDFESLLVTPQIAQQAEQLALAAGFDRIEWHVYLRRQDEYFWSLYSENSKHVFVDPAVMFHEVMRRGYVYFDGATGARAGSPFWRFCFDWSMVEKFACLVTGKTVLYSFADEVPFPGREFIVHLTGSLWSPPPALGWREGTNARLSDPEIHENYALRFAEPLEEAGRHMLASIIRRRARVDSRLQTLINEQLRARYFARNQAILERFAVAARFEVLLDAIQTELGRTRAERSGPPSSCAAAAADMDAVLAREAEARRRQEVARQREVEAQQREVEAQRREVEAQRREGEAQRREAEVQRREEVAQRREAEAQWREGEAQRRAEIALNEVADARAIRATAEAQLAAVLNSTTWRATAPLRNMVGNTATLRRALQRFTKARAKT